MSVVGVRGSLLQTNQNASCWKGGRQVEEEVLSLEWLQSFTPRVINQDLYPQYDLPSSAHFHASSTLEDSRATIVFLVLHILHVWLPGLWSAFGPRTPHTPQIISRQGEWLNVSPANGSLAWPNIWGFLWYTPGRVWQWTSFWIVQPFHFPHNPQTAPSSLPGRGAETGENRYTLYLEKGLLSGYSNRGHFRGRLRGTFHKSFRGEGPWIVDPDWAGTDPFRASGPINGKKMEFRPTGERGEKCARTNVKKCSTNSGQKW